MKTIKKWTIKGKVVYKKKKHNFKWRDCYRIANTIVKHGVGEPWTVNNLSDLAYLFILQSLIIDTLQQIPTYPKNYMYYFNDIKRKWTNPRSLKKRSEQISNHTPDELQFTFRTLLAEPERFNPASIIGWWLQKKILAILPVLDIINEIKTLSEL